MKNSTSRQIFGCITLLTIFVAFFIRPSCKESKMLQGFNTADNKQIGPHLSGAEYASEREQQERRSRFLSTEERVKYYMGIWHSPPCTEEDKIQYAFYNDSTIQVQEASDQPDGVAATTFVATARIKMARMIYLKMSELDNCDSSNGYCNDAKSSTVPTFNKIGSRVPILVQFGDNLRTFAEINLTLSDLPVPPKPHLPVFMKARYSYTGSMEFIRQLTNQSCLTTAERSFRPVHSDPIIWLFNSKRHYGTIPKVGHWDIPWKDKRDVAVFRGGSNGLINLNTTDINDEHLVCMSMQRCKLVYNAANSTLVDARLTNTRGGLVPDILDGVHLLGDRMDLKTMLEYKAIIMLEGNDVSTGLKWALYSNSVVFATPSKKTSWAMEDLLEPWVHYIPLNKDMTDMQEKMQWVIDNNDKAKKIAYTGSLWIKDMLYHPKSKRDDEAIFDEIARRYKAHFKECSTWELKGK